MCLVRFHRMEIFLQMMRHHPRNLGFKFHAVKSVKPFGYKKRLSILQLPYTVLCCVNLIMVTITSHMFQTVHFSAVKFTSGNEKNMSFLLTPKSHRV